MGVKTNILKRVLAIFLCITLIMTSLPFSSKNITAADSDSDESISLTADSSTMDGWQQYFPTGNNVNTENAGAIWTDKSVFTDDSAFSDVDITMNEQDSFLVALSAMGSNISVTGMSASPTDTMLVLDVSGSMNGRSGNNDVAAELAEASNYMISTLLAANKYNRVGVVLYSGDNDTNGSTGSDNAIVVLPLGRYTTRNDIYLTYKSSGSGSNLSETISLNTYVYYEGTSTKPTSKSKQVIGSTYTQKGIILAKDQFTASSNETTIDDPNKGTLKRKPIMVLMSDGAPTYSTTNFTNPGSSEFGNGQTANTAARDGFLTQLSAAYAKSEIEKKYDSKSLFYTLALGLDSDSDETSVLVARNILNPDNNYTDSATEDIDEFWEAYDSVAVGEKVTITNRKTVTKIENELNRYYVDKFFDAEDYGSNMQEALVDAFKDIAKDIQLQSKYFPTYTEANENLSGYVSFIDRIGKYMEVTNVEGISINQTLYRGDNFAKNFGSSTGSLGTINSLTSLGEEMVETVAQHIGLSDTATAKTLINLAYQNGQLAYNSSTRAYSNYIGWFADADGKYLGFWYDGISESTIPATAAYIMKSYVYLGEVPEEYGMKKSDVMYAIVQLREDMKTKDQRIVFAVPAALMPTITYDVSLDKDDKLEKIETSGAIGPIRLIYKAALREEINKYTIDDVVDSKYIEDNKNADGSVNFYTNQYEVDNFTGYEEVNTYSYFKPSREDERYYYQENAPVYADDKGTLYSGNSVPTGEKYHAYTVYSKNGTTLKTETRYNIIDTEVLATAKKTSGENTWYIPAGDLCRDYVSSIVYKTPKNETGTLPFSMAPFADIYGHSVDETDYYFVVGATLGNNGKLTVDREAGLKITKELAEGISYTNEDFEFILTNTSNATDNTVYPAYKIDAEGTATDTQVKFVNGVSEGVYLKAGEMIYIAGMTVGDVINVKESETDKYKVETVNLTAASQIDVAIKATEFIQVDFVNAERGKGNVTISTEIIHPFGPDYVVPDDKDSFDMTVTVTLNGEPLKNQSFNDGDIVTDENGQVEITLKDGEELEIKDLPEGTVVKVVQGNPGDGFTTEYFDNGESGDGTVTIEADKTADVKTENEYEYTTSVNPVNVTVEGTVILTGRPWEDTDEFTFRMQKWNSETNEWEQVGTDITVNGSEVSGTNNSIGFDFTDIYRNNEEYSEIGSYLYRIVEIEPEDKIGGVTYDKTVHSFVVEVTDEDMDAALEIKDVYSNGETQVNKPSSDSYEVIVDFENIYSTTGQQDVSIDINKLVVNEKGSPLALPSGFKFGIYDGAALVAESTATDESGFARIVLNYGPEDLNGKTNEKYNYILKEIVPDTKKDGWIYSVEETVITVELESVAGVLKAVVYEGTTRPEGAVTSLSVDVTNTYDPGVAHLSIDFVNKNLIGKSMVGGEFTFGVFKHDQVIRNASTAEITGTNNRAGNVIFNKALSFDKVGVYNYDIVELTGDGNGITADKNTYRVEVTVTDDNGQLKAEYEIENAQGSAITFVNTYEAKPVTNAISGIKELTGRELINDEFTFRLTEALDATGDVASNAKEYTAKNGVSATNPNEGTFTFPEITYDTPGTYYYLITEDTETGANAYGVNYDDSKYVATVVIKDDGSGSLKVASVSYGSASEIRFTNTYHVAGTDVIISGTKVLEGKELSNEEFSFTLYNSDNSWNQGTEVETVKNKADGSFAFNKIDYDTAGTYYYLVKEAEGDKGGVTYDTTVYRVKVVITDDMLGQLHKSVSIFDGNNVSQTSIKFINGYAISGTDEVKLPG
ncbi:MAG: hypothetical protein E7267_03260, partial [Lachnospiraceae bacterium]|nr:hypothetical protein [Lachnospiraceae bacterium]